MPALVLALSLIAYGNLLAPTGAVLPGQGPLAALTGVALSAALLAWARVGAQLSWDELGLRGNAVRAASVGLAVGLLAIPALAVLRFPPLVGGPVTYGPIALVTPDELMVHAFVFMPLGAAIPEEVAFRGVLLGLLRRRFALARAVVLSAAAFTLSHIAVVVATLRQTNLVGDPLFVALGLAGAFGAVCAGGALFALLRVRTGHLAAPAAAHWAFNAVILLGLRWLA